MTKFVIGSAQEHFLQKMFESKALFEQVLF